MKPFHSLLLAVPVMLGLVSCQTTSMDEMAMDDGWTAPESQGLNYVDINGQWRMQSDVLDVVRDEASHTQVLMASAQNGVVLTSLKAPQRTRVSTKGTADAIYYDAYQNRFELVGNPVVEQGLQVTQKSGNDAKIVMYGDGGILQDPPKKVTKL